MIALILLAQVSLIPMTLDSVAPARGDSVDMALAWGYDSVPGKPVPHIDSVRVYWLTVPDRQRSWKLSSTARRIVLRFAGRKGLATVPRTACARVWQVGVPVLRCVSKTTAYLIQVIIKPDSVTLEASPPPDTLLQKKI